MIFINQEQLPLYIRQKRSVVKMGGPIFQDRKTFGNLEDKTTRLNGNVGDPMCSGGAPHSE